MELTPEKLMVFDWETSGSLPEYALQPWRVPQNLAWGTSLAAIRREGQRTLIRGGILASDALPQDEVHDRCRKMAREIVTEALDCGLVMGGWNTAFDVALLIAYGCEDLVKHMMFVDGMLLWRHWFVEPEYETDRFKKKSYGLKEFVRENLPQFADYEAEVDFHDPSPESRERLHRYNV